ncbi:MAG: D-ribose ABC transporter substrate-binding protein [Chloroflexi bacterium]|nr:D-ribose ABC transporter substrate-binding protein [Chloroflexota bacterium]
MSEFSRFKLYRLGSIVLVLLLLLLTGCSNKDDKKNDSSKSDTKTPETLTVGLLLSDLSNPFFVSVQEGAQTSATRLGITLVVQDGKNDAALQITQVQELIALPVNALLINPVDGDAIVPAIQAANAANIPVFTIDRSASGGTVVAHIASDNVAGGAMAAEYLADNIGDAGKIVELQGIEGTSAAQDRGRGFDEKIATYPNIEIVVKQTANFDQAEGKTVFAQILADNPEITAVFAHNDNMILGAIEAAKEAGRAGDIKFVGFDGIDGALTAIDSGDLLATIAQQPAEMGRIGVETADKVLKGGTVDSYIPVDLAVITK